MTSDMLVFFFQAEDGIRDGTVTGVQTCALPIYQVHPIGLRGSLPALSFRSGVPDQACGQGGSAHAARGGGARSEERRVGKEWRGSGPRGQQKRQRAGTKSGACVEPSCKFLRVAW